MKNKRRFIIGTGLIGLAVVFQSCATVFGGKTNTLVFTNEQNIKAEVFIDNAKVGEAQGKVMLPKKIIQHGSELEIRAEGYETQSYLILLKPHVGYVLGDFAVGAIPLIADFATGDILRPQPRKFVVEMEKTK